MGGVNVEPAGAGGRRAMDSEINMIPMIDLLMVTISFLLITAVWSHMSRLTADASVPGPATVDPCEAPGGGPCKVEKKLHVEMPDASKFVLVWREGRNTVRSVEVPRSEDVVKQGSVRVVRYPALAAKITEEWQANGAHRDPTDRKFDRAVVHASNDTPYASLVGVLDAVADTQRPIGAQGRTERTAAFDVTFATD